MTGTNAPTTATEVFLKLARTYAHIDALGPDWLGHFGRQIRGSTDRDRSALFQRGLAQALAPEITRRDYEYATGWDFDTDEELVAHLQELWDTIYPGEDARSFR